ncbi:MAG: hypothetical protein ACO1NO_00890 [Burkholderiaceae bacterium]
MIAGDLHYTQLFFPARNILEIKICSAALETTGAYPGNMQAKIQSRASWFIHRSNTLSSAVLMMSFVKAKTCRKDGIALIAFARPRKISNGQQ